MTRPGFCFLLLLVLLCGCTAAGYRSINPAEYGQTQKIFDLTFGWNLKPTGESLLVEGYARNTRYYLMRDLVLVVSLLATDGAVRASETILVHPSELRDGEMAGFSTRILKKPQQGETLRFQYRYVAIEGNDETLPWMNSFDVPADR
jgi:hypothetical protein